MTFFSGLLAQLKSWNRARKQNRRNDLIESDYLMWRERNKVKAPRSSPNGFAVGVVCFVESLEQLREVEKALATLQPSSWGSIKTTLIGSAGLISQRGECWSDVVPDDPVNVASIEWIEGSLQPDWYCFCAAGCVPTADALAWMAEAIRRQPSATMVFGDAELDTDTAPSLFAKPEPALLFQIQTGYVGDVVLVRQMNASRLMLAGSSGWRHFLYVLGCDLLGNDQAMCIRVPRVLAHCSSGFRYIKADLAEAGATCYERLLGARVLLELDPSESVFLRRVSSVAPDVAYPLVSVIIPTRDRLNLLKVCVESLLRCTDYPALEVLIVDNGSIEDCTLSYMRDLASDGRAKVIRDDGGFNYSRLNNLAVGSATGQFVLLLNNDIEVTDPGWLKLMVDAGRWARVGCVGARLHYPSGELQHAGLALASGGGVAHVLRASRLEEGRGHRWASFTHEVSAVTGACLLISRDNYRRLGGLNEQDLGVAFNDVDLCLRACEAGLINVYVGEAHLLHYESISRGSDAHDGNIGRWRSEWSYMNKRWGKRLDQDCYANPNYSRYSDQFELSARISKW
jgi:GT2 family glycosyltransferase